MRILHSPYNIAGQATMISRAQRMLGQQSDVLVRNKDSFDYDCDINLALNGKSKVSRSFVRIKSFITCFFRYDVFHFHFGKSFLPFNLDLPILRLLGKKTLMHYWGSDVVQTDVAKRYMMFSEKDLDEIYPGINNKNKRIKISLIDKFVGKSIVGDYSLLPFSPDSIVVRQAIDIAKLSFVGCEVKKGPVKIVHAPSKRKIKGTEYVMKTIERLKKAGCEIDFMLVENVPNCDAINIYKTADIVVDDILQGPYGIFAIECMALGKPVIDYVKDYSNYNDLPIVSADPGNLYEKLLMLIEDPGLRVELGKKGRKYVEKNHDSKIIARDLIDIYRKL